MRSPSYLEGRDPAALLTAIGSWWRELMSSHRDNAALEAIGQIDVDRMAHDLGMSADDLVDFASHGIHAAEEAPQMMAALGIDPEELQQHDRAVYVDILRNCMRCGSKRQCVHDLHNGTAEAHFEEYCINADTLDALRAIAASPQRQSAHV